MGTTLDLPLFLQTITHSVANLFLGPCIVPISCRPHKNNCCNCDRGNSNLRFQYLKCTWPIFWWGNGDPEIRSPARPWICDCFCRRTHIRSPILFFAHAWCQFHIGHVGICFATASAEIPISSFNIWNAPGRLVFLVNGDPDIRSPERPWVC